MVCHWILFSTGSGEEKKKNKEAARAECEVALIDQMVPQERKDGRNGGREPGGQFSSLRHSEELESCLLTDGEECPQDGPVRVLSKACSLPSGSRRE